MCVCERERERERERYPRVAELGAMAVDGASSVHLSQFPLQLCIPQTHIPEYESEYERERERAGVHACVCKSERECVCSNLAPSSGRTSIAFS